MSLIDVSADESAQITSIPVDAIRGNPDQPRKLFDAAALDSLAESIKARGLIQPISVRPAPDGMFEIIAGERRWRAHKLAGLPTVRCIVVHSDEKRRDIDAIVENMARQDVTPLEEARAFDRMMRAYGMTVEELAAALGLKQPWRITERMALLKLKPEYQDLLAKGHLTPSQGFEMSKLEHGLQAKLFDAIKSGKCQTYHQLRAVVSGMLEVQEQGALFDMPPPPTAEEIAILSRFEKAVEKLVSICAAGFDDNEVVVVRKVDPGRAQTMADKLALMQRSMAAMERALRRQAAVQLAID